MDSMSRCGEELTVPVTWNCSIVLIGTFNCSNTLKAAVVESFQMTTGNKLMIGLERKSLQKL